MHTKYEKSSRLNLLPGRQSFCRTSDTYIVVAFIIYILFISVLYRGPGGNKWKYFIYEVKMKMSSALSASARPSKGAKEKPFEKFIVRQTFNFFIIFIFIEAL